MAGLYTYPMSAWINYWSRLAEDTVDRLQEISEEIENRKYGPSELFSDVLGFWWAGATGWWNVMQQGAGGPVPIVFLKMMPDEESASEEISAQRPGKGNPKATPTVRLVSEGKASGDVEVTVTASWAKEKLNCLVITVEGLSQADLKAKKKLRAGLYQASVHQDEKLLAIVQVLVE
jgi:hypothetical protein